MSLVASVAKSLVPISQFNKGKASSVFDRLRHERGLIVLKNNQPTAYILSPDEFYRVYGIEDEYNLLLEAYRRLQKNGNKPGVPMSDVIARFGFSKEDLMSEDVEIE